MNKFKLLYSFFIFFVFLLSNLNVVNADYGTEKEKKGKSHKASAPTVDPLTAGCGCTTGSSLVRDRKCRNPWATYSWSATCWYSVMIVHTAIKNSYVLRLIKSINQQ